MKNELEKRFVGNRVYDVEIDFVTYDQTRKLGNDIGFRSIDQGGRIF